MAASGGGRHGAARREAKREQGVLCWRGRHATPRVEATGMRTRRGGEEWATYLKKNHKFTSTNDIE